MKLDENNYMKNSTVCKSFYNMKGRKNNKNTLIKNEQPKIDKVNNDRTLIIKFSNCVKIYLMNRILH